MNMATRRTVTPDADPHHADWTKQTWDLPPYMSKEFLEVITDLDAFKHSATYQRAVENGLIMDDEWVGDNVEPAEPL